EQNGSSKCLPCKEDEYIEYPNDFTKCLGCRTCREDQVELSPCRAVSNTQCACRNGTFCSPDHPCEMCQKCRPRCPEGEVEQAPCTPHSDRQCGPPTGTVPNSSNTGIIIGISLAVALVIGIGIGLYYFCCSRSEHGVWGNPRGSGWEEGLLIQQLTRCRRGGLGTQDNIRNEQFSQDQLLPRTSGLVTPSASGLEVRERAPLLRRARPSCPCFTLFSDLFPSPLVLRRSFDIFAQEVPYPHWKRYGRALDLLENEIALATLNDQYSLEPFFQMLNTWLNKQGMNASVNTLLETLHQINLGGIAEDISSKLVQQGYFQYEVN
ncbi:TR10B factor, partial [Pelecanoides urinatrix]|nr:TR10B factor [Pelecanoides urinatrix]